VPAGVWCRTDAGYGVQRAPTEGVLGVAGLGCDVAESDQAELAEAGVNSFRAFPRQGIRVWGACTLSSDPERRSASVRRVFLHLASSIDQGTRWTVFEPNDEQLWEKLREQVEHFLDRSWRDGALAGETAMTPTTSSATLRRTLPRSSRPGRSSARSASRRSSRGSSPSSGSAGSRPMLVLNENPRHPHVSPDGALVRGGHERAHEPVGSGLPGQSDLATRPGLLRGAASEG
jgi:hypothetical protein